MLFRSTSRGRTAVVLHTRGTGGPRTRSAVHQDLACSQKQRHVGRSLMWFSQRYMFSCVLTERDSFQDAPPFARMDSMDSLVPEISRLHAGPCTCASFANVCGRPGRDLPLPSLPKAHIRLVRDALESVGGYVWPSREGSVQHACRRRYANRSLFRGANAGNALILRMR